MMGRKIRNARLDSREARSKLAVQHAPYWVKLARGWHLGYRKEAPGKGAWHVKFRPPYGKRTQRSLGEADDSFEADRVKFLSYKQAQDAAERFCRTAGQDDGDDAEPHQRGALTVCRAIEEYLEWRELEGRGKSVDGDRKKLEAHVLPIFGDVLVSKLTASQLRSWRNGLIKRPARVRSAAGDEPAYRAAPETELERKARRSTANRVWATFKAALNHAKRTHRGVSDDAWRDLAPFRGATGARERHLSDDEAIRLVNACQGDLRDLVSAALLSGCRYGELAAVKAEDFHADSGTLHIRAEIAKSGKARHIALAPEGVEFFGRMRLRAKPGALLLTRDGKPWTRSAQEAPLTEACGRAGVARVRFHELRHTYASRLIMRGVPMAVVSSLLGHSSVKVTEAHYAHLQPDFVSAAVRNAIGWLGIVAAENVRSLKVSG
jgi:integrase